MTDSAPSPEAPGPSEQTPPEAPEEPSPRASRGPWFILLILIVVVAGAGYYWVEFVHRGMLDALEDRVAAADRQTLDLAARLDEEAARLLAVSDGGARVDAALAGLEDALARLQSAQGDLEDAVKGLYARESRASLDWVLAEAEYLVMAASQRLALEGDVDTARAALVAADNVLRAAQHPELIALRETLAGDIAALEAVAQPDVEGLAIYLAETVTRVDGLPTRPIADIEMSFSRMGEEQVEASNWRRMAQALWSDLRSLVEIKDGELQDGVLFDPELRYFLQQNLRLELASARLAVLRRDTDNFRAACRLVTELLDKYYDPEAAAVRAIRGRLTESLALELAPPLPSVSASLDAVRAKRAAVRDAALAGS